MYTKASLDKEHQYLSNILSREDIPTGIRASLASAKQKLDALYAELSSQYAEDGEWVRDAAMGLIQVERVTRPLDQPEQLYGVDTPVFSVIHLRFYSAEVNTQTGEVRPVDLLAETKMPESQWGAAIASPNAGHGASTLLSWKGEPVTPYDPDKDPVQLRGKRLAAGLHRTIDEQHTRLRDRLQATLSTLQEKKRLGKKDAQEVARQLGNGYGNLPVNIGFRAEQLVNLANDRSMALANEINLRSKGEQ